MPAEDVSDLRDVVDAINRLCDTMKTSHYDDACDESVPESIEPSPERSFRPIVTEIFARVTYTEETSSMEASYVKEIPYTAEMAYPDSASEIFDIVEATSPEEVSIRTIEVHERWSDSLISLPLETVTSDAPQCDPVSEMYYTASSEVSLLSDTEVPERATVDDDSLEGRDKDERKECVIAGHVAAMRERFESMTRTNTPCPDLMRSSSPSLDVFRNITPSPDRLG